MSPPQSPAPGGDLAKVRLNKRTIDEAVYEGLGSCYLWDTDTAG